jgi:hypothetical protein
MTNDRGLRLGQIYRYPRPEQAEAPMVDGLPNFYWHTSTPGLPKAKLERGITRLTGAGDLGRVPAILVRCTPWKAGTPRTPWHDYFVPDDATVHYFGDNKVDEVTQEVMHQEPAEALGNRALLQSAWAHAAETRTERASGAPVLLMTGVAAGGRQKGNVRFDGLGIVTRVCLVRQYDDLSRQPFPNLLFRLRLLDLSAEDDTVDWDWISGRRRPIPLLEADRAAPAAWKQWVAGGHDELDGLALRHWRVPPLNGE